MLHFTEDFDFSERPNTGEQGLEDTGNFLQCCAVTSARVRHRPDGRNVHMNNDIILLAGCEIIECQCTTTLKLFGTLYEHEVTVSSEEHVSQIRNMATITRHPHNYLKIMRGSQGHIKYSSPNNSEGPVSDRLFRFDRGCRWRLLVGQ